MLLRVMLFDALLTGTWLTLWLSCGTHGLPRRARRRGCCSRSACSGGKTSLHTKFDQASAGGHGGGLPAVQLLFRNQPHTADVFGYQQVSSAATPASCCLLQCRETDENISEPMFINLSYVQAQHDYLAGNYPVVREDAAQVRCQTLMQCDDRTAMQQSHLAHQRLAL